MSRNGGERDLSLLLSGEMSLEIEPFRPVFYEQAESLARLNYEEERTRLHTLPEIGNFPSLERIAGVSPGFAAVENGNLVGFICGIEPGGVHSGQGRRIFVPIHAHGAVKENRNRIYSRLYEAAAKAWVDRGIISHAIALYAHDPGTVETFFWNGFGLRCIDALCQVEPPEGSNLPDGDYFELPCEELVTILPLKNELSSHLNQSPMFLPFSHYTESDLTAIQKRRDSRFFCVRINHTIAGYIEITSTGENFITRHEGMANICGAYLSKEYRGSGIFTGLLGFLLRELRSEGYNLLGVDFESFNPTARGFWLKQFTPYTFSVMRWIERRENLPG